jgi:hypothetical protein
MESEVNKPYRIEKTLESEVNKYPEYRRNWKVK